MELDSKPYGAVSAGRHLHVWGFTLTVWCFALWIVFPALLIGLGSGVGIGYGVGYGAFHDDDPCLGDMSRWLFEDGVDPAKHPIALVNGSHFAVADHTVDGNSCIVRYSGTLKAKGLVYYPHQGRRLNDGSCNGAKGGSTLWYSECFKKCQQLPNWESDFYNPCVVMTMAKQQACLRNHPSFGCKCPEVSPCEFCSTIMSSSILAVMNQGYTMANAQKTFCRSIC
jgi:hypothetical protein